MKGIVKKECCGCGACKSICPKHAISFSEDKKGFLYPTIDEEQCIDCGLCEKVCNLKSFIPSELECDAYAVRHKDEKEVATSRSGAVFIALSAFVLSRNGVVFGADNTNVREIVMKATESRNGLNRFKGSKYVQADTGNTYDECANYLNNNRWVLYSGTACQVHSLLQFLNNQTINLEKLITVDIVCHGVASPGVWKQYLDMFERRVNDKVLAVNFRDKGRFGWREHIESYKMASGRTITGDKWKKYYYNGAFYRDCCYECKYTTTRRYSDFTIADLWGVEKVAPEYDDDKGVSLVLVRTKKAREVFDCLTDINAKHIALQDAMQPQLCEPPKYTGTVSFWDVYRNNNMKAIRQFFFKNRIEKLIEAIVKMKCKLVRRISNT